MNGLEQLKKSKHGIRAVFLDDGGVLNDNRLRAPLYRQLIADFMAARLGGSTRAWADANGKAFPLLWSELQSRITDFASHKEYQREYELQWVGRMCSLVDIPAPPDDVAIAMAREVHIHVAKHARTEVKGAAESVWNLVHAGYALYAASGTPSWELKEIFQRMGIHKAFREIYGPDLVDHVKHGAAFYDRLFAEAGVFPRECLVIESSKRCCRWSIEAGATAVWVDCEDAEAPLLSKVVEALL